ncbi:MAG TPA: DNA mismatch repair protein MutS [Thermoanaerobaculia bacterium]|nr:DNA mismatch repair protein MutS [Thermoanaerobaculia bacterium]
MKLTPMLEQYFEIKRQVPDAILFYRLGDFYELFFEDAEKAAPILDLVLTARGRGGESETPMCGVPYHAANQYVAKLVKQGFRVALCDQIGEAAAGKGLVKREIVRVVTPGTAIESSIIDRESCYLLSLAPSPGLLGAAYLDVSTGDFFVTSYAGVHDSRLFDDMARLAPREMIFPRERMNGASEHPGLRGAAATGVDDALFEPARAAEVLSRHFETKSLRGFGLEPDDVGVCAAGAALRYASASHRNELAHVRSLRVENDGDFLLLDAATLRNLQIFDTEAGGRDASLWNVFLAARTAMGTRTLRKWLARPLRHREPIFERHDAVDELVRDRTLVETVMGLLARVADLERLSSRLTIGSASPRECLALSASLGAIDELEQAMQSAAGPLLSRLRSRLDSLPHVAARIAETIEEAAPATLREGGVIRRGVSGELDSLREISRNSKGILLEIEAAERKRTGISTLKIRFNGTFGYYLEVSNSNLGKVPSDYIRKQTLVNAERFITPELKELEEKIVGAEEKSIAIEQQLYSELIEFLTLHVDAILTTARAIGELDTLSLFAATAVRNRYVRPALSAECEIAIEEGRHPVVERVSTERFIPNDCELRRDVNGIHLITGPNMGGKSTYLRQVALIVLMSQAGSFVPASRARLGCFDRIFTRVGASDDLARGESTFMVEMHETANILNNASDRSLVVLDEVGRGTATFDGLSLAWAILEYLHDQTGIGGLVLFATHYHELTELARDHSRMSNFHVAVKEWNEQIIFLRKVVPGSADKSYGIQVAKLAGVPGEVIARAKEILQSLDRRERDVVAQTRKPGAALQTTQLSLFRPPYDDVVQIIRTMPIDGMTPLEALNTLQDLKKRLLE